VGEVSAWIASDIAEMASSILAFVLRDSGVDSHLLC